MKGAAAALAQSLSIYRGKRKDPFLPLFIFEVTGYRLSAVDTCGFGWVSEQARDTLSKKFIVGALGILTQIISKNH